MRRLLLLAPLLTALAALPTRARAQADSVFLRPGDLIHLVVFRQADFTGDFTVGPEGTIEHPLLSDVNVVGVPRSVIRERLRTALTRYVRDPDFVFDFLYRVSVGGEVRLPNLLNLSPQTTIAQAVAAAGGATEFGRMDRVRLFRDGREMVINLQSPDENISAMRIHSGDQIRVTRRGNLLRDVLGPFASIVGAVAALAAVLSVR
jgi:polysaccharide export outer membrane protein